MKKMKSETTPGTPQKERRGLNRIWVNGILNLLATMKRGGLILILPNGERRQFGQPGAQVTALIRVMDWNFFKRCVLYGDVGFGESYVAAEWETDDVTRVIAWFILNVEQGPGMSGSQIRNGWINILSWKNRIHHRLRPNSLRGSPENIADHYDLGNAFYELFLDQTMTYSSALFQDPGQTLEEAQTAKYNRICNKLKLQASDCVLEIGGGWGGFAIHCAKRHGCRVKTITLSGEQFRFARERVRLAGLDGFVEVVQSDYRKLSGQFDKIVSIEMIEAVGDAYLETFFKKCHELLKPHGLLAMQMIVCPDSRHAHLRKHVDWIQTHIFPGSLLVSIQRVNEALFRTGDLCLHELEDMGLSYGETLRRWRIRFAQNLKEIKKLGFDDSFIRKWNYYLCYCEAAFDTRNITVAQAVCTRPNNPSLSWLHSPPETLPIHGSHLVEEGMCENAIPISL